MAEIPLQNLNFHRVENSVLAKALFRLGVNLATNQFQYRTGGLTLDVGYAPVDILAPGEPNSPSVHLEGDIRFVPSSEAPPPAEELLKILPAKEVLTELLVYCGLQIVIDEDGEPMLLKAVNNKVNLGHRSSDVLLRAIAERVSG